MPLYPGQVLRGHYQIQAQLGQGGFGIVYRALDTNLNRLCAIKENLDASPGAQQRFLTEAQILANLRNEHLPQVIEYFIEPNGLPYLVMEFIAGQDLETIVGQTGPQSESQALAWAFQILQAIEYLHERFPPVIHRDIKPANILIAPGGNAFLVDFGIAKIATPGTPTATAARAVTPGYSPPEQYSSHTDQRSDIYSFGATLYFALTGAVPPDAMERVLKRVPLTDPAVLAPALSRSCTTVILRALELEPSQRFSFAREMDHDLGVPVVTPPPRHGYGSVASNPRPNATFAILVAFIGGIGATVFMLWFLLGRGFLPPSTPVPVTVVAVVISPTVLATNPVAGVTETRVSNTPVGETLVPSQTPMPTPTQQSATLAPTTTPFPLPTLVPTVTPIPAPITIFQDEFTGTNLDLQWDGASNAGVYQVTGDALVLSSRGTSYPYVVTRTNPFPVYSDFRATFTFDYVRTATCGVGMVMTSYTLPWGMSSSDAGAFQESAEQNGMAAGVFDYADGLHVIYRSGAERRDFRYPKPDRFLHSLVISLQAGRYVIDFDDVEIFRSQPTTARANFIWIGHPAVLDAPCDWDSLDVGSIRVEQLP